MLGAIVGDVVGSPFEADNVKRTDFRIFAAGARCTDDSVLTVATADVLLNGGDYASAYQDYYRRYPNAGYGGSFIGWAARRMAGPYGSWGNGSAMRVSPVGWARDTLAEVLAEAERSAAVTHNHPDGIVGAQAVAGSVFIARTGGSKDDVRAFVEDACGYPLDRSLDEIRPTYEFDVSCRGSVPVAVRAFLESTDFETAVRLGVSVGGDSDTIACMAGAIAHAHYGRIPGHLLDPVLNIYLCPVLAGVALEFCERFEVGA
ncbi:MAG TPA: ADP-ribosylglycohydrolase family protein [Humisphaera sp.]